MRESQCQQKQSDGLSGGQLLRYDQVEVHSASALSYRNLCEAPRGFNGSGGSEARVGFGARILQPKMFDSNRILAAIDGSIIAT
jgi:hypothetical protein